MIEVTDKAAERLKKAIDPTDLKGKFLRVFFDGFG